MHRRSFPLGIPARGPGGQEPKAFGEIRPFLHSFLGLKALHSRGETVEVRLYGSQPEEIG